MCVCQVGGTAVYVCACQVSVFEAPAVSTVVRYKLRTAPGVEMCYYYYLVSICNYTLGNPECITCPSKYFKELKVKVEQRVNAPRFSVMFYLNT